MSETLEILYVAIILLYKYSKILATTGARTVFDRKLEMFFLQCSF